MARRITLQLSLNQEEAELIKDAAHLVHMRPSQYALERLCQVSSYEIALHRETHEETDDIDNEAEADALLMLQGAGERLQRWRSGEGKPKKKRRKLAIAS